MSDTQLWGGRFAGATDALMRQFNDSIGFDIRLWREDIQGSQGYARALHRASVITDDEHEQIQKGLHQIFEEFASGSFDIPASVEDIHGAVEHRLMEIIGDVGGKLHTGRSRNDQVATDIRLWMKHEIEELRLNIDAVIQALVDQAEAQIDIIMPGYTHLQPAQPVRAGHWLLSYAQMLKRDRKRLRDIYKRVDVCPLGSGALSGNPFGLDRKALAKDLGFDKVSRNSMDAVSDRDSIAEVLFAIALTGVHLSRLAEDLIIYSSAEFHFIELDDAYSTGSSLMPQKKNPDSMELVRGKSGRLLGHLVALLTSLKGTPSTYNKDFQEDKQGLFDAVDTISLVLPVMRGVIQTLQFKPDNIKKSLDAGMLATELADYLVAKKLPFREAHHIVGAIVREAIDQNCTISELPIESLQKHASQIEDDVYQWLDFERAVERKNVVGGTAREAVLEEVGRLRE